MSNDRPPVTPSHIAYQVREGQDEKAYFNRVGAAFKHKDGQGYNIELDAMPVDGRVILRTPQQRLDAMREDQKDGKRKGARRSRSNNGYGR